MLTLGQLLTPVTQPQALATLIKTLDQTGYQASSWQSGSLQLTFLNLLATTWAGVTNTIAQITAGGFTTLATGPWLTAKASFDYELDRLAPQQTIGTVIFTSSAGAPSHTFAAGDIQLADQPNATGQTPNVYTNTTGGTLAPGSTLAVTFKANVAGAAGNIAPNTTLYLWTPLVGVTPTNPVVSGSNTWITAPGSDAESDARLQARCIARWSQLTYGNINGAYEGWALEALPALTRVGVLKSPGDGNVTVVGATALGGLTGAQITTIQNYIAGLSDGKGRRPINDVFSAVSATVVTSPALTVTVYANLGQAAPATSTTAEAEAIVSAAATKALLNYFGSVPIGGSVLSGTQGRVLYSIMQNLLVPQPGVPGSGIAGVRSAVFSITSDVLLNPGEIYVPAITVVVSPVAPGS